MGTNIWKRFEALIKPEAMAIVTILALHADGTCTAEAMGGGTIRLRGTSVPVGEKAFAAGGEIRGPAPNLTYYELEV